ncbi:hypothetical protein Tco_1165252 [Tanacetum coccineum]
MSSVPLLSLNCEDPTTFSNIISSSPHSTIVPFDSDTIDAFSSTNILNYFPTSSGNIFSNSLKKISPPENIKPFVGSLISLFPYLSLEVLNSKKFRCILQISKNDHKMPPKRSSTSATPAITLAAIQQLITDGISSALKVQAATIASASNPNRNTKPNGTPVAKNVGVLHTTRQVNTAHSKATVNAARPMSYLSKTAHSKTGNPQMDLQDQEVIDSGCSRHMTGYMSYLTNYEEIDGMLLLEGTSKEEKSQEKTSRTLKVTTAQLVLLVIKIQLLRTYNCLKTYYCQEDKDRVKR